MPLHQDFAAPPETTAVVLSASKSSPLASGASGHRFGCGFTLAGFLVAATLIGCHSSYIDATIANHTTAPISVVQVEYPSASFGTQTIAPGADFHYRFKILGSGQMKITWTDTAEHEQKSVGPTLQEGTEGRLTITVASDGVHWQPPPAAH